MPLAIREPQGPIPADRSPEYPAVPMAKRIAITTLFVFLYINDKWLRVDNTELYNFAVWVAQSPPKFKEQVVQAINKFLKDYMQDI